jgi:hypothetical protein
MTLVMKACSTSRLGHRTGICRGDYRNDSYVELDEDRHGR